MESDFSGLSADKSGHFVCDLEKSGSLPALPVLHSAQPLAADKRMHCDSFRNTRGGEWGVGGGQQREWGSEFGFFRSEAEKTAPGWAGKWLRELSFLLWDTAAI